MSGKEKKKRAYVELIIMRGWFYAIINDLIEGKLFVNFFFTILRACSTRLWFLVILLVRESHLNSISAHAFSTGFLQRRRTLPE